MSARTTVKAIQDIMRQDSGVDGDAQRLSQLCWMFFLKIIDDQDQQLEVMQDGYRQLMRQVINRISGVDFNELAERRHFGEIYEQLLNDLQSAGNAGEYYTPRALTAFMVDRIDPRPGETLFDPSCGTGGFLTCAIRHMRDRYVKRPDDEARLQAGLRAVEKKRWTTLGTLVAHSDSGWSPKTLDHPRAGDEWGVLKVSAVSWGTFRAWENKQVLPGTEPRLQALGSGAAIS